MKTFSIILIMVSLLLTGCSTKQEPKTTIVYETKEILIPVPCKVPTINCDFSGEGFIPTQKLLDCVILQKRALEACSSN